MTIHNEMITTLGLLELTLVEARDLSFVDLADVTTHALENLTTLQNTFTQQMAIVKDIADRQIAKEFIASLAKVHELFGEVFDHVKHNLRLLEDKR